MKMIQKELLKFFKSKDGEEVIGQIILNVINHALVRDIKIEDGRSEPGKKIEKIEQWNLLDFIAKYIPYLESAVRGVQVDTIKARNRSCEVYNVLSEIQQKIAENKKLENKLSDRELIK